MVGNMKEIAFRIQGMDCAEEIAALKHEVGPLVGGEQYLGFDLLQGKMLVKAEISISHEEIEQAVKRAGMRAELWDRASSQAGERASWWEQNGRTAVVLFSGLCLILAFLLHARLHGAIHAFAGAEKSGHVYPLASLILYVVAIVIGGWYIYPKAFFSIRRLRPDMNLLMTIAVIGAMLIGEWLEGAMVVWLFSIALLLESWSVGRARKAIRALLDLTPTKARYICPNDGDLEEALVEKVPLGATVLVRPGEKIPLDGILTKGETTVNQSPITGESMPVSKRKGDEVFAGTINGNGAIEFKATKISGDTTLARIIKMVEEAQSRRAQSEQWVETFARYYTPAMMGFAILLALGPPLLGFGSWSEWFYQALVVLVIACPCALVISTPVSIVAGLSASARQGVLIKGGIYLEEASKIKAVALDKTGTLTLGKPKVQQVFPFSGHTEKELLEIASSLEEQSDHPLAHAILEKAREMNIDVQPAEGLQMIPGKGIKGTYEGKMLWLGSHRFLHEKMEEPQEIHEQAEALEEEGHSVVFVGNEEHICGLLSIADTLRPKAKEALALLKNAGVEQLIMLTGDNQGTAKAIASQAGLDTCKAELLPEEKTKEVEALMAKYEHVAMVGDGVNDAPAMAVASLGIAMGAAGTDAAIETADIALMSDDLSKLGWLVTHSQRTLSVIQQNIVFALGLKVLFVILALAGVATLWMAIAADMGASLIVIFNGLRLLRENDSARIDTLPLQIGALRSL